MSCSVQLFSCSHCHQPADRLRQCCLPVSGKQEAICEACWERYFPDHPFDLAAEAEHRASPEVLQLLKQQQQANTDQAFLLRQEREHNENLRHRLQETEHMLRDLEARIHSVRHVLPDFHGAIEGICDHVRTLENIVADE